MCYLEGIVCVFVQHMRHCLRLVMRACMLRAMRCIPGIAITVTVKPHSQEPMHHMQQPFVHSEYHNINRQAGPDSLAV